MKNLIISLVLILACTNLPAQHKQLSSEATIHIITVGPYQPELYSAFGHSGIRVLDPVNRIDDFYNYGVFDFDQPNFYLNFARGFLNYRLAVMDYRRVRNFYVSQNRYIHEQVLNFDQEENQKLYEFLEWNAQPENMYYYYDYFYDNCATRVRDAVEQTFKDKVEFDGSYIDTDYTIRDLTDIYLQEQPWGDLGIDLCLGLPMDKKATPYMYMFLPDYIELAFDNATILKNGTKQPLIKRTIVAYEAKPEASTASAFTPLYAFSLLALVMIFITYRGYKKNQHKKWIDVSFFTVIGLLGWLLFLLWVATDHNAAATNFNLLWALPFHFPLIFWLLKKDIPNWVAYFYLFTAALSTLTILLWAFLPQNLHNSLIPITLIVLIRGLFIYHQVRNNERNTN
ncbi:DUF4105 domain-containing protein [Fulvivirga sp. RKSG066]|uniref:lipoprotein N-acyltransferase Lnb domain-containing protein n=1 Tax=Fulvivirga aurantia TaxID=2529383 RepID=UPI0012BB4C10|nr:DUF4105 domain-containing protein [Fulvivirga aurantia]MTI22621.1 DUF4105 domain-containing protein [Fulvivirga aurantia]